MAHHLITVLVIGPVPAEPATPLPDELLDYVLDYRQDMGPLEELQLLAFDDEEVAGRLDIMGLAHDAGTVEAVKAAAVRALPGDDPVPQAGDWQPDGICEYLYDDSTLAGAIHLDMYGEYMRCKEPATHTGVLPADEDQYGNHADEPEYEPLVVRVCNAHRIEAEAQGLHSVQPLVQL